MPVSCFCFEWPRRDPLRNPLPYPMLSEYTTPVEVTQDRNAIEQVILRSPHGSNARISLHGGQILSWRNGRGEELLFTSRKAVFKPPTPVRGGIIICFPQFGNVGELQQHGFARNKIWTIEDNPPPLHRYNSDAKAFIDLLLKPLEDDLMVWPHSFEFRLRVSLSEEGHLTLISRIRNIHSEPFNFLIAYNTYFNVSHIEDVRVEGLETLDYLDNLQERKRITLKDAPTLTFESEIDRVYLNTSEVTVFDHGKRRKFFIRKHGLPDVVVWNPWEKKSRAMVDFGDDEYEQMLCVNGAAVEKPITLEPGEEWTNSLALSFIDSA